MCITVHRLVHRLVHRPLDFAAQILILRIAANSDNHVSRFQPTQRVIVPLAISNMLVDRTFLREKLPREAFVHDDWNGTSFLSAAAGLAATAYPFAALTAAFPQACCAACSAASVVAAEAKSVEVNPRPANIGMRKVEKNCKPMAITLAVTF